MFCNSFTEISKEIIEMIWKMLDILFLCDNILSNDTSHCRLSANLAFKLFFTRGTPTKGCSQMKLATDFS